MCRLKGPAGGHQLPEDTRGRRIDEEKMLQGEVVDAVTHPDDGMTEGIMIEILILGKEEEDPDPHTGGGQMIILTYIGDVTHEDTKSSVWCPIQLLLDCQVQLVLPGSDTCAFVAFRYTYTSNRMLT